MNASKAALRKIYKEKRKALMPEQLDQLSNLIVGELFNHFKFFALKNIHVYIPISAKFEVNTWPLINKITRDMPQLKLVVPKVEGDELEHYVFDRDQLEVGAFGVQEPIGGEKMDPQEIEMVIVPLLIFDKKGYRVGYGKGFYDRFLSKVPKESPRIGFCAFEPIDEIVDVNDFDQPLSHCIVPGRIYTFES